MCVFLTVQAGAATAHAAVVTQADPLAGFGGMLMDTFKNFSAGRLVYGTGKKKIAWQPAKTAYRGSRVSIPFAETLPVPLRGEKPMVHLTSAGDETLSIPATMDAASGSLVLDLPRSFKPGLYHLVADLAGTSVSVEQDFAWGVLAVNPSKDRYRVGETADFAFGVLDAQGAIVCDAALTLTLRAPDGSKSILSTTDGTIAVTGTCGRKEAGFIDPDYRAQVTLDQAGTYVYDVVAATANGVWSVSGELPVVTSAPVMIRRLAATRLWPFAPSPMTITVHFDQDFAGTIADTVPAEFSLSGISGNGSVQTPTPRPFPGGGGEAAQAAGVAEKIISWKGSWKAGETQVFSYLYDAPDVSPEFYLVGPLALQPKKGATEQELRQWQIASDTLAGWYSNWLYRKQITIKNTNIDATLSDFPLYVKLDADTHVGANAQSDGDDIRFTSNTGAVLPYERELFSVSGGDATGHFWVKVPSLVASGASSSGAVIYMYYGSGSAPGTSSGYGLWDTNYAAVYHLGDAADTQVVGDSTRNNELGTKKAVNEPTLVTGQMGNAMSFDGANDYISLTYLAAQAAPLTLEAWIKPSTATPIGIYDSAPSTANVLRNYTAGNVEWWNASPRLAMGVTASVWNHFAATYAFSTKRKMEYFRNGAFVSQGTGSTTATLAWTTMRLGDLNSGSTGRYTGILDEFRISKINRSRAWLKFEYNNMANADQDLTWGVAVDSDGLPAPTAPVISSATASPQLPDIGETVTFSTAWTDVNGDSVKMYVCKAADGTTAGCGAGGTFCSNATSFTSTNPQTCTYVADEDDLSSTLFYTYICDSTSCSYVAEGALSIVKWVTPTLTHRKAITVSGDAVTSEDIHDFPLFVKIHQDADVGTHAQGSGADLRFATASGQILPYERISYTASSGSGSGVFWVKAPKIVATGTAGSGAHLFMYYGSGSAPNGGLNASKVWTNGFRAVWHLDEQVTDEQITGSHADSTGNGNTGTQSYNGPTSGVQSTAQYFDGSSDWIDIADSVSLQLPTSMTISAWVKPESTIQSYASVVGRWNTGRNYMLLKYGSNMAFDVDNSGGNTAYAFSTLTDGNWHHTVGVAAAAGGTKHYRDGAWVVNGTYDGAADTSATTVAIGTNPGYTPYTWKGGIDEVRVQSAERTASWINFEYNNLASADRELSFGSDEEVNNTPTITSVSDSPDPVSAGGNVTFSVDWNDADAEGIKMYICKAADGTSAGCGAGGTWCSNSNDVDLTDPITCTYAATNADTGTQNYYAYVCDDQPRCSTVSSGTFDVVSTWLSDFSYRKALTIANANVDATLNNFPLYVKINADTDIGANAQSDGDDIRFATSTGMILPHEEESFSVSSGSATGDFWVKVPKIVASGSGNGSGATIYMYYGSGTVADGQNASGVWDAYFKGVWHLSGATLHGLDSTANDHDTTSNGVTATTGKVDGAGNFAGSYYLSATDSADWYINGDFTAEAWVNWASFNSNWWESAFIAQDEGGGNTDKWMLSYNPSSSATIFHYNDQSLGNGPQLLGSTWSASTGTWYHIAVTRSGNTFSFYKDGATNGTASDANAISDAATPLTLGIGEGSTSLNGLLDELRLSKGIARSAAWLKFEYYNVSESDQEIALGAEQQQSGNFAPVVSAVSASPNPVEVGETLTFSAAWTDADAEGVKLYVCKAADGTTSGCGAGGAWCTASGSFATTKPATCTYAVKPTDTGSNNYYVYVCDDAPNCSAVRSGSFEIDKWLSGFYYRKRFVVSNTNVDSNLSDFPLYVKVTADTDIGANAQSDGDDLRFTTATGMVLPYEEESFSVRSGSGSGNFWVKVPTVKTSTGTVIYLYYGSGSAADGQNASGVWDKNFRGVWHLTETPTGAAGDFKDSTSNNNDSENTSNQPAQITGKVNNASNFNGSSSYIDFGTDSSLTFGGTALTAGGWYYLNDFTNDDALFAQRRENWQIIQKNWGGGLEINIWSGDSNYLNDTTTTFPSAEWFYMNVTYDGSFVRLYKNGALVESFAETHAIDTDAANTYLAYDSYSGYLNGYIDEARLSSAARSSAWIKFEYYNMNESDQEISWATQEVTSGNIPPIIASVNASPNPVESGKTLTFSANWTDMNSEGIKLYVCKAADGTTSGCGAGGAWCTASGSFATTKPATCTYPVTEADTVGTKNFYVYVCDDQPNCSTVSAGSFDVGEWLSGFNYRKRIVIDHTYVDSNLSNFPVYVKINADTDIGSNAQSDGDDIRFTSGTGMVLPHEEESFSVRSGSGSGNFWVKVPTVKTSTGTVILLYYGSGSAADGQNASGVWDANFKGVWHLSGSTLHTADSTSNAYHATNNGATSSAGTVDGAGYFDGGSATMNTSFTLDPNSNVNATMSAWIYMTTYYNSWWQNAVAMSFDGNYGGNYRGFGVTTGGNFIENTKGDTGVAVSLNNWHFLSVVYSSSDVVAYLDGSPHSFGSAGSWGGDSSTLKIGWDGADWAGYPQYFVGTIDEARVADTNRSAAWVKFEYYNIANADHEISLAAQEITSANIAPSISTVSLSPDPVDAGDDVTFSVTWTDSNSEGVKLYVCKAADGTTAGCGVGGTWCTASGSFALTTPATCTYAVPGDASAGSYQYYAYVCDDEPACSVVSAGTFDVNEWLSGFNYRKRIIIDNTNVDANLSDFPVYVKIHQDTDVGSSAQSDGDDIRFTSGTGMVLPHEEETFSVRSGSGSGNFWVKVPTVKTSTGTVIYLYYGNGSAVNGASRTNVWDSNFKSVLHLSGSSLSMLDSTSTGNNGTNNAVTATEGRVDGGGLFDGNTSNVALTAHASLNFSQYLTAGVWVNMTDTSVPYQGALAQRGNCGGSFWQLYARTGTDCANGAPSFGTSNGAGVCDTQAPITGAWVMLTGVFDGTRVRFYRNGIETNSAAYTGQTAGNDQPVYVGWDSCINSNNGHFLGRMDEARVSNIARSAAWIKFEYYNMSESDQEISWASEEVSSVNAAPVISAVTSSPDIVNAGSNVTFSVTWTDANSEGIKLYVCKAADGTTAGCGVGGTWCTASGSFALTNPATCTSATQASDTGTQHYYAYACDDEPSCSTVSAGTFAINTWLSGFTKRKRIIIDNTNVDANLSDFPVYVKIHQDTDVGSSAQSDGDDIRFTSGTGMVLPHEEEYFSVRSGSGSGHFWVKVPTVKTSTGTVIYLYYGSGSATDGQSVRNVWDANFKGVWHMSGSTLHTTDSTSNANVGTNNGMAAALGKTDGGGYLNGSSNVAFGNTLSLSGNQTIGVWVNANFTPDSWAFPIIDKRSSDNANCNYALVYGYQDGVYKLDYAFNNGSSWVELKHNTQLSIGTWYRLNAVYDGSKQYIYINGVEATSAATAIVPTTGGTQSAYFGYGIVDNRYFTGSFDEVRLSSTNRSAAWIKFEYYNMSESDQELAWAAEESGGSGSSSSGGSNFFYFLNQADVSSPEAAARRARRILQKQEVL